MKCDDFEGRKYIIATLVKLLAEEDVECICSVAKKVKQEFNAEDIIGISDDVIYDAYIEKRGIVDAA